MNRPGIARGVLVRRHGGLLHHGVVAFLGFSGRDIADGLEKPSVVEPVDPFEGGVIRSTRLTQEGLMFSTSAISLRVW